jgi:VIT1/CCC1 family predicted Fe2+/Mn2+ transporter
VLGANDGIVSTASLVIGVAATSASRDAILTAGIAGLVAGAMSMAAGEYVSVGSQRDVEQADLARERRELATEPEAELDELTSIYEQRGVAPDVARTVAVQLMRHDPLAAHMRDELGLTEEYLARPWQAAWTSAASFAAGAAVPLMAFFVGSSGLPVIPTIAVMSLVALGVLGWLGALAGGAPRARAAVRVLVGGSAAMALSAVVGELVGAAGI